MGEPAEFWNRIADKYAKQPVKDQESYQRSLDATRKYLSSDQRVLELGCGTGSTALALAPGVRQIIATDISSRMLEIARENAATQRVDNVRFEQATVHDFDFETGACDVVMAFNFLHLLRDLPAAVRGVHDSLKPGGVFVSKTVCLGEQTRLWAIPVALMRAIGRAPYVNCLKVSELERVIVASGLEILETSDLPTGSRNRFIAARRPDR